MGQAMSEYALVSVIVPCFCCATTLERAVESILSQTVLPRELIMVDDASNDEGATRAILNALQQAHPEWIKVILLTSNEGPGSARNAGWAVATQPYIAFLDADDSWHPEKIALQWAWMQAHPEIDVSGHRSVIVSIEKSPLQPLGEMSARTLSVNALLWSNVLPLRTVMLKTRLIERFLPGKRQAEDYLLWLTLGFSSARLVLLSLPLAYSYKADFGQAGLNGQLTKSFYGVIDTYYRIYQSGKLSFLKLGCLIGWATIKHLRRCMIQFFR